MHHNHEHDGHRKEVKMRGLGQLSEWHGFTERRVGTAVMLGEAFGAKFCHTVRPKKRKNKSGEH